MGWCTWLYPFQSIPPKTTCRTYNETPIIPHAVIFFHICILPLSSLSYFFTVTLSVVLILPALSFAFTESIVPCFCFGIAIVKLPLDLAKADPINRLPFLIVT